MTESVQRRVSSVFTVGFLVFVVLWIAVIGGFVMHLTAEPPISELIPYGHLLIEISLGLGVGLIGAELFRPNRINVHTRLSGHMLIPTGFLVPGALYIVSEDRKLRAVPHGMLQPDDRRVPAQPTVDIS